MVLPTANRFPVSQQRGQGVGPAILAILKQCIPITEIQDLEIKACQD